MTTPDKPRVGFLGLGAMGARMARRLVDAGYPVTVWNRSASKADPLVAAGATAAASPREAARDADAVLTMLADPDALRAVVEGDDGLAAGLSGSTTVIEMSTVGPAGIEWLASALAEGTPLLDAPVLGSLTEAEGGTLKVFIGGDREIARRWEPLLSVLGDPSYIGPS